MPDFRSHRVPPLQPPTGMSPSVQPGTSAVSGNSAFGRTDTYPGTYTLHRGGTFPSLSSLSDMSRISQFTTTPRGLEGHLDRAPSMIFGQTGPMLMDSIQRIPQPITDAPPFSETTVIHSIMAGGQTIKPEITAKIHKGFFQAEEKWTCYRRNYFAVSCSFTLQPWTHAPLFVKLPDHQGTERILSFSMCISAIVNGQHGEIRELVQHTPKRDKQSERKPAKVVLQPFQPPPLVLGHGSAPNSAQHGYGLGSQAPGIPMDYSTSYPSAPQPSQPPTQHTFERIQFQKATANNGKRRAQQQYYNLVVELYAQIPSPMGGSADAQWVKIARKLSHPMVVRGRSPGHYKDGRRDSSTSMGPDGGSGGSGDGSGGAVLPPGIGQAARSHLTLVSYDSSQRGGPQYGRADYHHQMRAPDQSSLSGSSPHISSSSSSTFDIGAMHDTMDPIESIKSTPSMDDSFHDPTFAMMDGRNSDAHFHSHLPPLAFEYDTVSKHREESSNGFSEHFDIMATMPPEQSDSPAFLKQPPKLASHGLHHYSGAGGYDPVHSTRSDESSMHYRLQNSQSLCA
ncbi:PhoG like DNA-binding family protein [Aspergillus taichungensis]|uniref:PhoG like DNA-binding family protein n=1 Tax=Aspergillus taichungensis TaxID=482145 RepID=A0A2J5HKZ9_9EURO|nr:PhoG like DNA-binding family protein [Aspergillus taichungensis]